jgi:hypothetical protein
VAVVNGAAKIVGGHRDRLAVVYLRQSSMAQVREHTESTMRQYGLVEEAVRLGWAREAVVVIDTDLGVSGRWGVARAGFAELVARVCTGEVGAIFGLEISRLARSNAEVARLMEFAAITETLLIDADGRCAAHRGPRARRPTRTQKLPTRDGVAEPGPRPTARRAARRRSQGGGRDRPQQGSAVRSLVARSTTDGHRAPRRTPVGTEARSILSARSRGL